MTNQAAVLPAPDSIEAQNISKQFTDEHVYANIGQLVEYIIKKSLEDSDAPIQWEELPLYPETDDWNAVKLHEYIKDELGQTWEDATGEPWEKERNGVLIETTGDDEELYEDELKAARSFIRDNAEPREPYEWYAVSQYLYDRLKEQDEVVVNPGGGLFIWGRCTTGQYVYMDYQIQRFALELHARRNAV